MLNIVFNLYPKCEYLSGYHWIHFWQIINALPALFHYKYKSLKKFFSKLSFLIYKTECAYIFFLEQKKNPSQNKERKKKIGEAIYSHSSAFWKFRTYLVCSQTDLRTCHQDTSTKKGKWTQIPTPNQKAIVIYTC